MRGIFISLISWATLGYKEDLSDATYRWCNPFQDHAILDLRISQPLISDNSANKGPRLLLSNLRLLIQM
jgi:hypothetical protein